MICQLKSYEVPILLEGARMFFDEGQMPGGLKPQVFKETWEGLLASGVGVVFGLFGPDGKINGALGAVTFPDPFNGDKVAIENFWFVYPQFRGRGALLLRAFEKWAKEQGCKRISMIHLQRLQPKELQDFYERLGYEHVESAYIKYLKEAA